MSMGQINIYYSFLQLKFNTFMLTAFKWLQKGSKMKNFRLFQVFTLIAFLLTWKAFKQNFLEQDIILEHEYGRRDVLWKRSFVWKELKESTRYLV